MSRPAYKSNRPSLPRIIPKSNNNPPVSEPIDGPDYSETISTREASKYLGVHIDRMWKWRMAETGPRYFWYGRNVVRYTHADLDAWREANPRKPSK